MIAKYNQVFKIKPSFSKGNPPVRVRKNVLILHSLTNPKKNKHMKKFFKGLGILVLLLIVVFFILCLAGPKENKVTRSIVINASPEMVMSYMGDFKFFNDNWSPWAKLDPKAKNSFEGEPGKVGHKFSWEGNDSVGMGSMTLDSVLPNKVVESLEFKKPWESQAKVWVEVQPEGSGSKVTWGMWNANPFMSRAMMMFMDMDKMLGADYEKGLAMLKEALEKKAAEAKPSYTINEIDFSEKLYFGKKATVKMEELSKVFSTNFPAIWADCEKNKVKIEGMPSGLFWSWDDKTNVTEMAAAIPVAVGSKEIKGWEKFPVPAGKALHVDYYGAYDKSIDAHMAIGDYIKKNNLKQGLVIEEYVTDPGKEPDTTKWLTKIYYLLQ